MTDGNVLGRPQEDEAREHQKYRLAFEQSRDAIMFLDRDTFQDCNPATLSMFRVPDVATFATLHPGQLSPPYQPDGRPSHEAADDHVDKALSQGQAFFEWRHRTWDGEDFPAEVLLSRIDQEEGPLLQAVVRDISERKEAEERIRSSEERYRTITDDVLDNSLVGIFILDADFHVVWINHTIEAYMGLDRSRVLGADKRRLIQERLRHIFSDSETFARRVLATYDNNTYVENFECYVTPGEGRKERWLEHWSMPIRSGLYTGGRVEFYQDITDRKQAEVALREREQALAEAQRIAQLGSWVSDFQTNEIRWSDEVYRIFGLSPEEWGATHESFMAAVHPDDRAKVQAAMEASFQGEPYDVTHRVARPDDEVRIVHERGYTEFDAEGEPVRMVGTVQDITEQRRLEDNLRRLVAILDSTPDIVSMHGGDGTMLYLNATGRRFVGLPERFVQELWRPETGWDRSDLPPETESLEGTLRWAHPSWAAEKVKNQGLPTAWREGSWQGDSAVLDEEGNEVPVSQALIIHRDDTGDIHQIATILRDISERRSLEAQLRREKAFTESILASLPGVFYMLDEQGRLVQWNDRLETVTGRNPEEMQGADAREFIPDREQDRAGETIAETFARGRTLVEIPLHTVEGETPYLLNGFRVELGEKPYILGVGLDISERRDLEDQLRREKALFGSMLSGLPGVFYMLDEQGRLVHWNDRMEAVTGRRSEELDRIDGLELVPEEEQDRIAEAIAEGFSKGSTLVESKLHTVAGETPYLLNGLRVELDGQPYLLGVGLDISEQKRLERELEHEATTDRLTGLPNRQSFDSELARALARHRRYGNAIALVMIDLDHFKRVNDAYGHDVGDRVLVELAERLTEEMREPDFLARWGGEEFVALLPETGPSEAAQMGERLRQRIEAEPFPEVGTLTISLGVTGFRSGDTANSLLKRVDDALFEAKRAGRNRMVVDSEDTGP